MARLYSNENFPQPVVAELRRLGHDVVTVSETGAANQAVPDMDGTHRGPGSPVAAITPEPAP